MFIIISYFVPDLIILIKDHFHLEGKRSLIYF